MRWVIFALFMVTLALARDPFISKEDAVGYIVIEREGAPVKYIVLESKEGEVKLIKTSYEPRKVLKQGGKKK